MGCRGVAIDDLGVLDGVAAAGEVDGSAAGGEEISGPLRGVTEGQRDHEAGRCPERDDGRCVALARCPAGVAKDGPEREPARTGDPRRDRLDGAGEPADRQAATRAAGMEDCGIGVHSRPPDVSWNPPSLAGSAMRSMATMRPSTTVRPPMIGGRPGTRTTTPAAPLT